MSATANPQAPERGRFAAGILGPFHVTGVFWYRFHHLGARIVPRAALGPFILVFTLFFSVALRRIRKAIASNLVAVLGPCGRLETERRIFRTLHAFAWCLTERYEHLGPERDFDVVVENREAWSEITADGKGFVVVTGHLGNWEIGSTMPSAKDGRTVHLVREEELDPRAQEFISRLLRERMGPNYHSHFASGDPRLGPRLLEALRGGALVALQGDRPRSGGRTLTVGLFGRPFDLPEGPLALARAAGVPLLPVVMLRKGRKRYVLRFGRPIRISDAVGRRAALFGGGRELAGFLESAIREEPHQWFCFRRLWPAAPARR